MLVSSLIAQLEKYPFQIGDKDRVTVSWSPRNDLIVTSTGEDNGLRMWNVSSGKVLWKRDVGFIQDRTESYGITTHAWSDDQRFVLTGTANGKIQLWNATDGRLIWNIKGHSDTIRAISVSPNAKTFASFADAVGDSKSELKIWEIGEGRLINDLGANHKAISAIGFISDSQFQTGNGYGQISIWRSDRPSPTSTRQLNPCNFADIKYHQIVYSPGFNYAAAQCNKSLVIINTSTRRIVRKIAVDDHYSPPSFSADGNTLFIPSTIDSQVLDIGTGRLKEFDDFDDGVLNNDGSLIAAFSSYSFDGTQIYNLKTGKRQAWLVGHPGVIKSLAFSSDGSRFASGSSDRIARIWDTETKVNLFSLEGHTDDVESVEFSDGDRTLISRSEKETIFWDAQKGTQLKIERTETRFSEGVAISPGGKFALVEEYNKPFRMVNTETGDTLKEFVHIEQLDNLAFTLNQKYFLVKPWWDGWQLWDVESGKPIRTFDVGYSHSNRVALHPDGKRFITGGEGQNIFMFDLERSEKIWSLFPVDAEEFEQKKAWEARRVGFLKWRENYNALADENNRERIKKITISFSHYGESESFWEQKIAVSGEPRQSKLQLPKDKAKVAWFKLTNGSDLPVTIDTNSMMFNPKCKGLCDGSEISSRYLIEMDDGKTEVNGYDMFSKATLPPNTTIYFSVDLEHLATSKSIYLGFTFRKDNPDDKTSDDYGTERKVYVNKTELLR